MLDGGRAIGLGGIRRQRIGCDLFVFGDQFRTTLLNSTAAVEPSATAGVNSVAADSWISPEGKFLYTAYLDDDKVVAYSIGLNRSLAKLGETIIGTASKLSLQGMVGI